MKNGIAVCQLFWLIKPNYVNTKQSRKLIVIWRAFVYS